jgi:transcriptional regulator with XRE-family HTH domain
MAAPGYGLRIVQARRRKGLTQVELCDRIGAGMASASLWENEKTSPQMFSWTRLAQALGVNVEWLRDGREPGQHDLSKVPTEVMVAELFRRGYRQG